MSQKTLMMETIELLGDIVNTRLRRSIELATVVKNDSSEDAVKDSIKLITEVFSGVSFSALGSETDIESLYRMLRLSQPGVILFLGDITRSLYFLMGRDNMANVVNELANAMNSYISDEEAGRSEAFVDREIKDTRIATPVWQTILMGNRWLVTLILLELSWISFESVIELSQIPEEEKKDK